MEIVTPYTEDEAREAQVWVRQHGVRNAWTASFGTAARMIGRLLEERRRLMDELATVQATLARRENRN